ncbi:helix-turn-helix transcriptional regulator [Peribacillus frigoritolerans]|uniref:helix-turn-helix transcriptional regulator n=1 Tax=Bacillaceae TaxID=186817 RepID=UPI001D043B44|nr:MULTISPECIES: helix-turn-helix transcriptional regulator [Bacillaceae]MCF7624229.1 helix-turn-helix transcriptional regulator [Peribacillus frigoritolerans]MCY9002850.1 helix-turn-helix transcriptional regulator [Peribacillus frigoritolerans]MDM5308094.1 helix-turn-helix transcriptional regulator [Peribacillus frigoritolerans]MEA3577098.1 helix-turn-helix transcriptional regulator [Peribacillus frigoritolerans]MEB2494273.1 helix-turn-helix transcriptional regulator [Peribacillus frigoritole
MENLKRGKVKNNVRYFRRLHDFTQEELSDRIGVHRQTIVALEKQKYEPSIGIVLMLSAVLNEPIDKLFFLEEKTD